MGAFDRILNYARDVNRKVGTTLTTEKAKKIRKSLILWGAIVTIIASIGILVGTVIMMRGFVSGPNFGSSDSSLNDSCPEMGEPGWFECETEASRTTMGKRTSMIVRSVFSGFAVVGVSSIVLVIGIALLRAGLAIVIVGEGAKFLDTAPKCPNCGDPVEKNEIYCNKCGTDLRNRTKCSNCGTQNEMNDEFCRSCGKKL